MPWPSWLTSSSSSADDDKRVAALLDAERAKQSASSWNSTLNKPDWSNFTSPQTITFSVLTAGATLILVRGYKLYVRRIPSVEYLKPSFYRRRSLYGYVTSVGDGDNFHLFHTPGGRLAGWGWLRGRKVDEYTRKQIKDQTLHVRIAGVDAPECAHFGKPAQPYSQEALEWLRSTLTHTYVRAYPYREDQYKRVVCMVYRRRWLFFQSDVGLSMLKQGWATVYEAKFGSEFGDKEEQYRSAEQSAKYRGVGMWQKPGLVARMMGGSAETVETPREYKTRTANAEKGSKATKPHETAKR